MIKSSRKLFIRLVPCFPLESDRKRSLESSNLHIGLHLHQDAVSFGTLRNVNTTAGEEKHKPYKQQAPFTNGHEVDLQLLRRTNVLQTLRSLADGAFEEQAFMTALVCTLEKTSPALFSRISPSHRRLLATEEVAIVSHDLNTTDIKASLRLKESDLPAGYPTDASVIAPGLLSIYQKLGVSIPVVHGKLIYYRKLSFYRQKLGKRVSSRVDMFVNIKGHQFPALLRGIFLHKRRLCADRCFILVEDTGQDTSLSVLADAPVLSLAGQVVCEEISAIDFPHPHLIQEESKWIWNRFDTRIH